MGEHLPEQREPPGIAPLLLEGERCAAELLLLVDRRRRSPLNIAARERHRTREHRAGAVARGLGTFGDRVRCLCGRASVDVAVAHAASSSSARSSRMRAQELGRPGEERRARPGRRGGRSRACRRRRAARRRARRGRGRVVRALPGSGRPARGGSRRSRRARRAPGRARRARRRSGRAGRRGPPWGGRRRRRRGSAGGGSGSRRRPASWARSGRISSRRTSPASRVVTCVSSGASACTAPRWKISPSTEPRSSTLRSASSSWSRRAASSAFSVGGTSTSAFPAAIASISEMNSGLPPAARAIRSRSSPETASPISASACSGGQRLQPQRPGQPGRRSTSSGRAMHRSRSGAPAESSAVDSTRSRNVSSPHWMSSKTTTSGACSSSSFRNAQAISSPLVATSDSPKSERIAAAATGSDGSAASCFTTSTTGQ